MATRRSRGKGAAQGGSAAAEAAADEAAGDDRARRGAQDAPVTVLLRSLTQTLHPALAEVAELILRDPAHAASLSVGALAAEAGTSGSTVVRLAHELGFSGYRQLRLALASETATRRFDRPVPDGDIGPGDDLAAVIDKISAADVRAVRDTTAMLSVQVLEAAVAAMDECRRVNIFGVGASAIVALDLQQKLTRIGIVALTFSDVHQGLTSAALLSDADVAIAITHSGATADTLDCLELAANRGATTIAVTNTPRSAVTAIAEHLLFTAAHETTFRSGATASRLAQLTVIDCLFVALAQRRHDLSQQALESTLDAVRLRRQPRSGGRGRAGRGH